MEPVRMADGSPYLAGLTCLFREMDTDDSGALSKAEFKTALASAGVHLSKHALDALLTRYGHLPDAEDAENGTGEDDITIRFDQFRELVEGECS